MEKNGAEASKVGCALDLSNMAGSKYAYVKNFELADNLLPNTFLVMRIDGHGFHR